MVEQTESETTEGATRTLTRGDHVNRYELVGDAGRGTSTRAGSEAPAVDAGDMSDVAEPAGERGEG